MSDNAYETVLERRIIALLEMCVEPKDLTPACKVAIEYWEKKYGAVKDEGWGAALNGKTKA